MHQRLSSATQWPVFTPEAQRRGFQSAWALPMRLRGEVNGALNMFSVEEAGLAPEGLTAALALADVATVALVQYPAANAQAMNEQPNGALHSSVLIEQARVRSLSAPTWRSKLRSRRCVHSHDGTGCT